MINYYENNQKTLEHYFDVIHEFIGKHKLSLDTIWLPHDAMQKRLGAVSTVYKQFADEFGAHKVKIVQMTTIQDGINEARKLLPKVKFDESRCSIGIKCLDNYRYKYDEKLKVFSKAPLHDWSSHGSDAFRYFSVSDKTTRKAKAKPKVNIKSYLDELDRNKGW